MTIRQVTYEDLDRVVQLLQQLWPEKQIKREEVGKVIDDTLKGRAIRSMGMNRRKFSWGLSRYLFAGLCFAWGRMQLSKIWWLTRLTEAKALAASW